MIQAARFFLGATVSGFCLWFLLNGFTSDLKIAHIVAKVESINTMWAILAIGSSLLSYPLNAMRLKYVLNIDDELSTSFFKVLPIVWVSSFLSLAAPSAAFSDGIRATLLRATKVSNLSLAIRAVLVDRAMGLVYTLGLAGILLLILPSNINPGISNYWGLVFLLGFLGAGIAIFFGSKLTKKIQLLGWFHDLFCDIHLLMSVPRSIAVFIGFAVLNTGITALSLWFIARAFSLDASFWAFFLLTPAILIVNNLPIFYQGFGGREAIMLFAFGAPSSGIPPSLILTISLVSGLAMMVSALFGALFLPFLLLRRNGSLAL